MTERKRSVMHYEVKNFEKFKQKKKLNLRDKTRHGNAYRQERKNKRRYG